MHVWANRLRFSPRPSPDACRSCFDASACIRMETMDASEMARRRWENVSPEERSRLTRSAALARWASAGESELIKARSRAATAREVRTRQLAARLLGVDFSSLTGVKLRIIRSSEFRNRKRKEQTDYWRKIGKETSIRATCVAPERARQSTVIHPRSFRMFVNPGNGDRS